MSIIHLALAIIAGLFWAAHQHITATLGGTPVYSGSVLGAFFGILLLGALVLLLHVVLALRREFRPMPAGR